MEDMRMRDEEYLQTEFERYYGSTVVAWERWEAWQWAIDALRKKLADAHLRSPAPVKGAVGKCPCGASYYRAEDIGSPCEIQYCRGTVMAVEHYSPTITAVESNAQPDASPKG
jgi:hypothetical protein